MKSLKLILIRLRSVLFSIYWYLYSFQSFKKELKKFKVSELRVTRVELWTTEVLFFKGTYQKDCVFIKLYLDKNKNQRESRILEQIYALGSNISLLKIIKDGVFSHGYCVIANTIKAESLESQLTKISYPTFQSLLKQFIFTVDDFNKIGIVHCDITPNNILVNNKDEITTIDFEYAVCKNAELYNNLSFENKNKLPSLGGNYSSSELIWDDAYSFYQIAKKIMKENTFSAHELDQLNKYLTILESKIGRNQYKY